MPSRRDQVQAQSIVQNRMVCALVSADPDAADNPHRPLGTGTIGGLLVATLIIVGFAVYGYLRPGGSTKWQTPGSLVVEKETGSRYVYVQGRLRPILNYASARLLLGPEAKTVTVSAKSLAAAPHGQPVGIPGAPDTLPTAAAGVGVWSVCAPVAVDRVGRQDTATTLSITAKPTGTPVPADKAVLVSSGGEQYLIQAGRRLRLGAPWIARVLGGDERAATPVPANWLRIVPAGPDLVAPQPGRRGAAGPAIDGVHRKVGDLFLVRGAGDTVRYYQLRSDGLAALNPLQYVLAGADPAGVRGGRSPEPVEVTAAGISGVRTAPAVVTGPEVAPAIAEAPPEGAAWCVRQPMNGAPPEITVDRPAPAADAVVDGYQLSRTDRTADAVSVAAGQGGLVAAGRFGQPAGPGWFVVTDAGVKYPVADAATAERLGFAVGPRPAPPELLDLLPTGPRLGAGAG
ncbi:type VII secretion protein EccB [Paractinoplanes atraurantiacus]|uniref:Type VII secretion protein EccB n=1 Tax=Paractinoplanes atraurantiacus TaxID=1036182 RepID=A0A285KB45_9ACTN|nr:type VII secretion protein EccB [Actinoplanes atraurantiacus]SNY69824.1 type VII secretion protein EccB [Actinoplanes atraurantiacus]